MQGWFKLYSTKNYLEANMIKGLLEENNIKTIILNMQDSSYLVFGEIELYVPVLFKDIAQHVLNNALSN